MSWVSAFGRRVGLLKLGEHFFVCVLGMAFCLGLDCICMGPVLGAPRGAGRMAKVDFDF